MKNAYDFDTMNAKLDDGELKLQYLRKKKYSSYIVETSKHLVTSFALWVYYWEDVFIKRMNILVMDEKQFLEVFVDKTKKF